MHKESTRSTKVFYPFATKNSDEEKEEEEEEEPVSIIPSKGTKRKQPMKLAHPMHISQNTFTPDAWDEDVNQEDKEQYVPYESSYIQNRPKKVQFDLSGAKMYGGQVRFEDINDDFNTMDVKTFRDRFEPPHVPDLEDEELEEILTYERKRLSNKNKILNDKMYEFIVLVSGGTRRSIARVLPRSTGTSGEVGPSNYRSGQFTSLGGGGSTGFATTGTTLSPAPRETLGSPPFHRRVERRGGNVVRRPPITLTENERENAEAIRMAEEDDELDKFENRQRLQTAYEWVEKVEVIGLMDLAPDIYKGASRAFTILTSIDQTDTFKSMKNFYPFIYTDITQVRECFADITSYCVGKGEFFFPTRSSLDANWMRMNNEIYNTIMQLSVYTWNNSMEIFINGDQRSGFFGNIPKPVRKRLRSNAYL